MRIWNNVEDIFKSVERGPTHQGVKDVLLCSSFLYLGAPFTVATVNHVAPFNLV